MADVDECIIPGTCRQICVNTVGSYSCACGRGYAETGSGGCKATGETSGFLIFIDVVFVVVVVVIWITWTYYYLFLYVERNCYIWLDSVNQFCNKTHSLLLFLFVLCCCFCCCCFFCSVFLFVLSTILFIYDKLGTCVGPKAYLLFANRVDIRRVGVSGSGRHLLVKYLSRATDVDYHYL